MYVKRIIPALLMIFLLHHLAAAQSRSSMARTKSAAAKKKPALHSGWPEIEKQMKPWARWWWMGNAVNRQNLNEVLQKYQSAGLGGVEITPIYGALGFEKEYLQYLSPAWMEMLHFTVDKAAALNMGIDMNTGTGWPFGGPQIKPENAATKLITQQYQLKEGETLTEPIHVKENKQEDAILQTLTAYGSNGEIADLTSFLQADGRLNWKAGKGSWEIYALFAGKTRQMVKRAAPGGEGYTLDHLDKKSVAVYLARFDTAFGTKPQGIRSFFNDSYEVFGATWTPTFLSTFKKNRGYDLSMHIKELVGDTLTDHSARLKSDYRETMSELLLNNFTRKWTGWAHHYQSLTRNQSHGSPGNLLDLYGAVDIPETETFGSSYFPIPGLRRDPADIRNTDPDPMMSKFASSAAHTGGKKLTSSETFTWLTEHFKTSFSQCKPEAEKLFLAGINHVFYHGTTNSPATVPWPGWLFYASVEVNPNNSLWPHIQGLNTYIARCQSILQAGKADNELLIYWPVYDVWNQAKGMDMALKVHDVDVWLHPSSFYKLSTQLSRVGYSFDFASDSQLRKTMISNQMLHTALDASAYKALVIPACKMMPVETLEKIIQMASAGATVIFEELPKDVPGLYNLEIKRAQLRSMLAKLPFVSADPQLQQCKIGKGVILLGRDIQHALQFSAIDREELSDSGLQFIRRDFHGGKYYYIVNHTANNIDSYLPLNENGNALILDPQSGANGYADTNVENGKLKVRIQLKTGEALILKVTGKRAAQAKPWLYLNTAGEKIKVDGAWALHFTAGGPVLPADQSLDHLVSWTALGDEKLDAFSGTGVYATSFNLKTKTAKEYVLNLNTVNESARVWVNGQEVGILWSIPFEARIGKYLKAGNNTLKIEVTNLMANRIRDMDRKKIQWRNYHEINFVNINYKAFDAADWAVMPSGLTGPVTITPFIE